MKGAPARTPRHRSIGDALRASVYKDDSSGVTFVDLKEREELIPWREIYRRAQRVAGALVELGIEPGDRVAVVLPTGSAFLDAFFGATLAGAIPVPVAPPMRLARLEEFHAATARMLQRVSARVVLSDARIGKLLDVAIATAAPDLGFIDVEGLSSSTQEIDREILPSDIALIQFSSGSTVDPKPIALSNANVMAQVDAVDQILRSEGERHACVSWLPLHHDMGLIGCLLECLYSLTPLVLIPSEFFLARPSLWLRAIARHRATASPAPSFAYSLCLKRMKDADLEGLDLSSWRFALNGAEPVSVGVLQDFATRFARCGFDGRALTPVYGMAEATLAVSFTPPGDEPRSLGVDPVRLANDGRVLEGSRRVASVGRAVPGVEVVIRNEERCELGDRRVGRIWVRGPAVMTGYFRDEIATARVIVGGWLDTGDLGFVSDGELYVCGRAKDVVIIRGANHTPQEFEECLEGVPGVRHECAVALGFVADDGDGDEALLILAERSGAVDEEEVMSSVRNAILKRTGVRAHTIRLLAPGTLPRTTSGKLRRAEALRRFIAGELARRPAAIGHANVARSPASFPNVQVAGAR